MDTNENWKLQRVDWLVSARVRNFSISGTTLQEHEKEGLKCWGNVNSERLTSDCKVSEKDKISLWIFRGCVDTIVPS
jgi:hypothetical protein